MGGGCSTCVSRAMAIRGGLVVACLVWLLVVGMLETTERTTLLGGASKTNNDCGNNHSLKRLEAKGKEKTDMNYMSKRRVPNGPDPIHNRSLRKSRRIFGRGLSRTKFATIRIQEKMREYPDGQD